MNEQNAAPAFVNIEELIAACVAEGGALRGKFPTGEDRHVLLASHELTLTGAPIVLLYLARSLRRLGWQPVLISPVEGPLLDTLVQESFPVLICPSLLENDVLPRSAGLFRFVALNTALFANAAAALNGSDTSVLWWLHETEEVYQNQFAQSMPSYLFSNIKVYADSPRSREHLLRHRPGYYTGVLPFGIPDAADQEPEPLPLSPQAKGKRIFAIIGTVERRKGQDVLLDAVGLLPEDDAKQCFFVFVGSVRHVDVGDRVRMAVAEQADRFQYIPQLPLEKLPALYTAVDCVICASRDDPGPITIVEGCQFSKAVICSEHTGMAALLERDHAGFVYGGDDPAALAHCIMQVLDQNAEDASAMRERARAFYLSNFSIASFDRRLETEILPELLGPALLNEKSDAQALLLRLAENGRKRLLHFEQLQKQELENGFTPEQEQIIRKMQARIDQLEAQNSTDEAVFLSPDINSITTAHFKPDFAPDNLRANNYICHFTVFKRQLLDVVGLFDPAFDGSQDHDMVLRLTEKAERVAHIPEILYYWRAHAGSVAQNISSKQYAAEAGIRAVKSHISRSGYSAEVYSSKVFPAIYQIRYAIHARPKISILIPALHPQQAEACVNDILCKTTYPDYEIILGMPKDEKQFQIREKHVPVRTCLCPGTATKAACLNRAALEAQGQYLVLLDERAQIVTGDWLEQMLMYAQRPDVGAVGAKLYDEKGRIHSAGLILGAGEAHFAGSPFTGESGEAIGYMGKLWYAQNCSAVSGACMMVDAALFHDFDRLDETLEAYDDVDFCLKLRRRGLLIVWTPYAQLRLCIKRGGKAEKVPAVLWTHWREELTAGDPYYNPNFQLGLESYAPKPSLSQHGAR